MSSPTKSQNCAPWSQDWIKEEDGHSGEEITSDFENDIFKDFRTFKIDIALNVLEFSRCTSSVALTPLAYQFSVITVLELEKPDKHSKIIH